MPRPCGPPRRCGPRSSARRARSDTATGPRSGSAATRRSPARVGDRAGIVGRAARAARGARWRSAVGRERCRSHRRSARRCIVRDMFPGFTTRCSAYCPVNHARAGLLPTSALAAVRGGWPAVHDVDTHRLDNGLTLHVAAGHPAPVVAVQAWVGVGSADETPREAGVAHVVEHMLFKGSARLRRRRADARDRARRRRDQRVDLVRPHRLSRGARPRSRRRRDRCDRRRAARAARRSRRARARARGHPRGDPPGHRRSGARRSRRACSRPRSSRTRIAGR